MHHRLRRFPRLDDGERPLQITDLETPVPLVDMDRLSGNLERMAAYAALHSLHLRPHVKTHKSPRIAAEQIEHGARGLTCATLREMEVMSDVSSDLLLAYPPVGEARVTRLVTLPDQVNVMVALDSPNAIEELALSARAADREIRVCVEVDVGMRRVGVQRIEDVVELARLVQDRAPLRFAGVTFYPGHIRQHVSGQDEAVERLRADVSLLLQSLERAGLHAEVVSGGSTPAAWSMHEVEGVTEVRPGTYVYNDRITVETGACTPDDCAFTILATVVSTAVPGQAVVDAGTKSLAREPLQKPGEGWGALLDRPEVKVVRMSEEHGILDLTATDWRPGVGDVVRIVPNHVCVVVHLNDVVYGVRDQNVETQWVVEARGR